MASIVSAGIVGLLGYGVSLMLSVLALRHVGTARTGAYFSTAPFLGALLAIVLLGEAMTAQLAVAAARMGIGIWLHLTERHEHEHCTSRSSMSTSTSMMSTMLMHTGRALRRASRTSMSTPTRRSFIVTRTTRTSITGLRISQIRLPLPAAAP